MGVEYPIAGLEYFLCHVTTPFTLIASSTSLDPLGVKNQYEIKQEFFLPDPSFVNPGGPGRGIVPPLHQSASSTPPPIATPGKQ